MDGAYTNFHNVLVSHLFGNGMFYAGDAAGSDIERHGGERAANRIPYETFYFGGDADTRSNYNSATEFKEAPDDAFAQLYAIISSTNAVINGVTEEQMAAATPEQLNMMFELFNHNIDDMIKKMLYIGTGMFFAMFLTKFMWSYVGLLQMNHLKEKYFAVILKQEQGWFDANNAFEFATKVQAQLEQIELGVGEKFGLLIVVISQLITGLTIAFYTSWVLPLVMLSITPLLLLAVIYLMKALKEV